ncbi:PH domain-containing protein [Myroides fluvii]|uniref:PH domain-containing protein n=1 Tax=Myroides fluvii TaxID=2572594 RepID=UPI001E4194A1|nr:PH domain-containing protein [Myroides fluvii]
MNSTFSNQQINIIALPSVEAVNFQPLHVKYKRVVLLRSIMVALFILVLGASGYYLPLSEDNAHLRIYKEMVLCTSIVFAVLLVILNRAGVRKKGYAVREHDIIFKSGLLNQKETTIPFNRVQHVEIYEGALLRIFGLCRIEFFTAGGSFGDLKIPGLLIAEANKIKAYVIEQVLPQKKEEAEINKQDPLNTAK